jgi:hypothetical protein
MRQKNQKVLRRWDLTAKEKAARPKKNLRELTAARMRPDSQKKIAALRGCDRTARKDFCAPWHFCAEATGQQKKILLRGLTQLSGCDRSAQKLRALTLLLGCDRTTHKKNLRALTLQHGCDRTTQKKILHGLLRDWKSCSWQTCTDRPARTYLRWPVRDRFNRSSIPVQPVLVRMVLVKSG